jgi:hypothetical protein
METRTYTDETGQKIARGGIRSDLTLLSAGDIKPATLRYDVGPL